MKKLIINKADENTVYFRGDDIGAVVYFDRGGYRVGYDGPDDMRECMIKIAKIMIENDASKT